MTADEFNMACGIRGIAPAFAVLNEELRNALAAQDYEAVIAALDNNF